MNGINRAQSKKVLLNLSQSMRNGKFIRVSKSALDELEVKHIQNMRRMVQSQPTMGKTIMSVSMGNKYIPTS
jgi:hypothetical protein